MKFYFTFGSAEYFPIQSAYIEVNAVDLDDAIKTFRAVFPDRHEGILNCAFYYKEKDYESCIKPYYNKPAHTFVSVKQQLLSYGNP